MISREEIEQKGLEFGIHVANVQRDYVFGWLLVALYSATSLKDSLILKGGVVSAKRTFPIPVFPTTHLRMPIMEAGGDRRLVRLTYDGVTRIVEPYALAYKRRKDGHAEEYLYVYDRTGGRSSPPGIKSLSPKSGSKLPQ